MRKLMWFTLGFGGACILGAYFYNPWLLPMAAVFLLLAGVFFVLKRWKISLRTACAIFLGASLGLGAFSVYDSAFLQNVRQVAGKIQPATIEVTDYSYATDGGSAFDGEVTLNGRTYKVRVYLRTMLDLEPGYQVEGNFYFQNAYRNQDSSMNNAGKGIFLFAYQNGQCNVLKHDPSDWKQRIAVWRNGLKETIQEAFPEDSEGFARALFLGDTTGISYELDTALKVSGIRHVIAVSGLHVSIVFGLLYLLAAKKRVLTMLIGIPAVILFAALSGFTPSVTRACIMQILMMLALLLDKEYDPPTALAFAVLIMLGVNPMTVCSVGFQLSVGCMIGIFLFAERIYNWFVGSSYFGKGKSKLSIWICRSISITLSTMATTVPLTAYYFGTVSLIGVFTNLISLWAITILFYGIMLVCALGSIFMPLAQIFAGILSWLIRYVEAAATVMASVPMAAVYTKSIYIVIWLVFAYVLLAIYLLLRKKPSVLFAALVICSMCVSIAFSWVEPLLYECQATMLDVGQGQAILLQSEGKTFLVDCGGDYDKNASNVTAETLLSQGVHNLDGIIITHYDADHAGGVPYLLTRISTENLFLPFALDSYGLDTQLQMCSDAAIHMVQEDTKICYGDTEITIFAPVSYNSNNESSMCVLFRTKNCAILIIGDRNKRTERILVSQHDLPKVDVLVAGHHGSKTSTSVELLEETTPEYVFISVGEGNDYGHPAKQTIDRLLEFGCKIFRTDEFGTVIFRR